MIRNPGNPHVVTSVPQENGIVLDKNGLPRNADGTFMKGVAPNPFGRKRCFDLVTQMAIDNVKNAMDVTLNLMYDESQKGELRFKIANTIMEWAAGKPVGIEEVSEDGTSTREHSSMLRDYARTVIERHEQAKEMPAGG